MNDYLLVSPDALHVVELKYAGEPAHGDSFHSGMVDGNAFPGFFWGCYFAYSPCSRYFAASWMERRFERKSVVIDLISRRYFVLPEYVESFTLRWPVVEGRRASNGTKRYTFEGDEIWLRY